MTVSKLAHVHERAQIGKDVVIEAFAWIEEDVQIGDGSWIGPHVSIFNGARIGQNCKIFPYASIAAVPQDLKFAGEYTTARIGDGTTVRENATINRGTASKGKTVVGENCLLMAYSHVAHDCILDNHIILGNAVQLAGEVQIDHHAILSGGVLVHQFSRIGQHVMVQGGSKVTKDIPPYVIAGRDPIMFCGLNLVGLKRRGFRAELIQEIQEVYRILYREGRNVSQALERIVEEVSPIPERDAIIDFVMHTSRGIVRGGRDTAV